LEHVVGGFPAITLADAQQAALMDRVERKYLTTTDVLLELLPVLWPHYRALEIEGTRLQAYTSLYHDTPEFSLYRAHHNGQARRQKVRSRQYGQTGQTFVELKLRDPRGRTRKERVLVTGSPADIRAAQAELLARHLPSFTACLLEPKLRVTCDRLTLVNVKRNERLTFDLNLQVAVPDSGRGRNFPNLVVIELKCDSASGASVFPVVARSRSLRSQAFSKYGVGCPLLYPELKGNAFKPVLLNLARMQVWQVPRAIRAGQPAMLGGRSG
jgi:hypothetical protein